MVVLEQTGRKKITKGIRVLNGRRAHIKKGFIEVDEKNAEYLLSKKGKRRHGIDFVRVDDEKVPVVELTEEVKITPSKLKIAYITCITNDRDPYQAPVIKHKNVDFYYFTDNKRHKKKENVTILPIPDSDEFNELIEKGIKCLNKTDKQRGKYLLQSQIIKVSGYKYLKKDYDIIVWHDGGYVIKEVPFEWFEKLIDKNRALGLFAHPERKCIYEELDYWNKHKKYFKVGRDRTLRLYEGVKFPAQYGLWAGGINIQNHKHEEIRSILNEWMGIVISKTISDQLALAYLHYILNITNCQFETFGRQFGKEHNRYFKFRGHKK